MKHLAQAKHHEWLMCLIMLLAILMCPSAAQYYLVYFEEDKSVSVVSGNAVSVVGSDTEPETGSLLQRRKKSQTSKKPKKQSKKPKKAKQVKEVTRLDTSTCTCILGC